MNTSQFFAFCLLLAAGCDRSPSSTQAGNPQASPSVSAAPPSSVATSPADDPSARKPIPAAEFARMFRELSEPDQYFFSDNYISNETSYLSRAALLESRAAHGAAYLGVGPEQNFSYIALTDPSIAFIVDIRRDNALLHLFYKALFDVAESRAHFLNLLLGRERLTDGEPGDEASLTAVIAHVKKSDPKQATLDRDRAALLQRITKDYQVPLSEADRASIAKAHTAFFKGQFELSFQLHEKNGRKYPSLEQLLLTREGDREKSFLSSNERFRRVQRLERENRLIPVVGDFAGSHALAAVAKELERRKTPVSMFYVSNVEQYIMDPAKWKAYVKNIEALPTNEKSLFVRCYLDQGRRHPDQANGERSATILASFDHFRWRQRTRGYSGFYQLATDGVIHADAGAQLE